MKKFILFILVACCHYPLSTNAQDTIWTLADKKNLIDNYQRVKKELNEATQGLSKPQWNFKETDSSWSIAQVVEHINMWHLITQDQIRMMLFHEPQPDIAVKVPSDSAVTSFIYEERKHKAPDLSIPTGAIPDQYNLQQFNIYIDRIIQGINQATYNFRIYLRSFPDGYMENMNQTYIIHYGHVDRHLRQIKRIKQHKKYPQTNHPY